MHIHLPYQMHCIPFTSLFNFVKLLFEAGIYSLGKLRATGIDRDRPTAMGFGNYRIAGKFDGELN